MSTVSEMSDSEMSGIAALLRDKGAVLPGVITRHKQALLYAFLAIIVLAGLILYIVSSQQTVTRGLKGEISKQGTIISKQDTIIESEKKRADDAAKMLSDTKTQDAAERTILLNQVASLTNQISDIKKTQGTELNQRTIIDNLRTQQINSIATQLANLPSNATPDQIAILQDQVARLQKANPAIYYPPSTQPAPTIHCQRLLLLPGC